MRLIDADRLIERLRNAAAFYGHETAGDFDTGRKLGLIEAEEKVAEEPTIEVEPVKHGRWIEKPTIAYCSCCHVHWTKSFIISLRTTYKYCPNCGARMDGGDKNA